MRPLIWNGRAANDATVVFVSVKKRSVKKKLRHITDWEGEKFQSLRRGCAGNVRDIAANIRMVAVEVRGQLQLKYEAERFLVAPVTHAFITG
jgi:hypothetical protein